MRHTLPASGSAPIIEWRTSGGLSGGESDEPDVVVRADGRVTAGARVGGGEPAVGRLPPERVQKLLGRVLDEHRFFDIDGESVQQRLVAARDARVRAAGDAGTLVVAPGPPFPDAGVTHLAA